MHNYIIMMINNCVKFHPWMLNCFRDLLFTKNVGLTDRRTDRQSENSRAPAISDAGALIKKVLTSP